MSEVGKKYQHIYSGAIYDCVYVDVKDSIFRSGNGRLFVESNNPCYAYKEYKEPRSKTYNLLLVEYSSGEIRAHFYADLDYKPDLKILAKKIITIAEGEGL